MKCFEKLTGGMKEAFGPTTNCRNLDTFRLNKALLLKTKLGRGI